MEGKDFRLAKEIKYIQRQAAEHDGCFVTIGPLAFFSTETGDAWMLEPSNQLAARLARRGSRTHRLRGNRHELHHRLERYLPHRGPRIPLHRAEVLADHHDPWLSYRRNRAIGPKKENWSRRLRGKAQVPPACLSNKVPKAFAG